MHSFSTNVWLWPGESAAWHFVSVPKEVATAIAKTRSGKPQRGFGSVKVKATIGATSWETSLFPDKKSGTYLLPLKANVRKKEGIFAKDHVTVTLKML